MSVMLSSRARSPRIAVDLVDKLQKRCRLKELIGEPPEGVEIVEDRGEVLIGLANEVRKLDAERRKIEERLGGILPMKPTYRKRLETRLKNVKARAVTLSWRWASSSASSISWPATQTTLPPRAYRRRYSATGCEPVPR